MSMKREDLQQLSKEELVEAYLALQGKLPLPRKTSRTSSLPPSTDKKAKRENSKPGGAKAGHKGHHRLLSTTPDEIIDHKPDVCPGCGLAFDGSEIAEVIGTFEHIDIPPVRPHVVHHQRMACRCTGCGTSTQAALPDSALGSPFGPGIASLVLYMKNFQLCSYQRLQGLLADVFGLKISQGAIMNLINRSSAQFQGDYDAAVGRLRKSQIVASDETGMRIEGVNGQQWVFVAPDAIVHTADFTRRAAVVRDMMDGHRPKYWISDRYAAQQKHGLQHQTCLAHLARDISRVLEVGDERIGLRLKLWIDEVFSLWHHMGSFAKSTIERKVRDLQRRIEDIVATDFSGDELCAETRKVVRKIGNAKDQLLTFTQLPGLIQPTNNDSERALRPAVIMRKVTNGFRAKWAADADCRVRTVVDTARLGGITPFHTITRVLSA